MERKSNYIGSWALALATLVLATGTALAQQRVTTDGHATDANPQVGGNGYNNSVGAPSPGQQFYITHTNGGQSHYQIINVNSGTSNPAFIPGSLPAYSVDQVLSGNQALVPP